MSAVCVFCGADKELPLGRCAGCATVPTGEDRLRSLVASTRMLSVAELAQVRTRIRKGEPLRPSVTRLEQARNLLRGVQSVASVGLTTPQMVGLAVANALLTPMLGYALWFGWRAQPGPGARQALWVTVPVSVGLAGIWGVWRWL